MACAESGIDRSDAGAENGVDSVLCLKLRTAISHFGSGLSLVLLVFSLLAPRNRPRSKKQVWIYSIFPDGVEQETALDVAIPQ